MKMQLQATYSSGLKSAIQFVRPFNFTLQNPTLSNPILHHPAYSRRHNLTLFDETIPSPSWSLSIQDSGLYYHSPCP